MKKLILSLLIIISLFTVGSVFADTQKTPSLQDTKDLLTLLVYILSRVRIPVANLAGKLMTNSLVNGEVFHLAAFMYQCRQILRVIANFVLVGVVLQIIYNIATSGATKDLGTKVWKILVTSLLINASRWMVGAMVDLSNLAVMGVSNIGYSMISSIPGIKSNISAQMICLPKETTTDLGAEKSKKFAVEIDPEKCANKNPGEVVDTIVPTYDDMSGPFMYFGRGVFKIFEFMNVSTANSSAGAATSDNMAIVISFAVKLFLMGMFLTPLFALLVVNLVRIFLIWMRFICGPIIAIRRGLSGIGISRIDVFFKKNEMGVIGEDYKTADYFDVKNIIGALFTPATVCATLFLAIIMISSIFGGLARPDAGLVGGLAGAQGALGGAINQITGAYNNLEEKRVQENYGIKIDGRTIEAEGISKVTLDGDIFSDTSGYLFGSFGYLIICVMTMGLMRAVFRVGLSTSELLSTVGKLVMDGGKEILTKGMQLPIGPGGLPVSLNQLHDKFQFKKLTGMINDEYVTPMEQQTKLATEKAWSDFAGPESIMNPYKNGSTFDVRGIKTGIDDAFKNGLKDFKSIKGQDKNYFKDNITNKARLEKDFEEKSGIFFKTLHEKIRENGGSFVDCGNNALFRGYINSWLEEGGADYLQYKDVFHKVDEYKNIVDGKDTGRNYDKILDGCKPFGQFVNNILTIDKNDFGEKGEKSKDVFTAKIKDAEDKYGTNNQGKVYSKLKIIGKG